VAAMEKKERVLIRFRPEIYECFELEAAYEGLRVGTIANRLLISEIKKVARVGKGHCVVSGSEEDMAIPEGKKQDYYVLPASRDVIEYLPEQTGKRGGKPINKQVTFYLTEEQLEILKAVVRIQDIRKSMDCGEIVTYRFAVLGLLLNNEALNRKQTVIR
jgi:hypothetical protein